MQATVSEVQAASPAAGAANAARGGVSIAAILTGALVVYAASTLFTLSAVAISRYAGYRPYRLPLGGTGQVGLTAAIGTGAALLLVFMWGGYTAGRMGRGAGWSNGFFVPITVAVLFAIGLGAAIVLQPGPGIHFHIRIPSSLPRVRFLLPAWVGIAAAASISLLAGALGGALGSRWHAKLERRSLKEGQERREARESFRDLREALVAPVVMTPPDGTAGAEPAHTEGSGTGFDPGFDPGFDGTAPAG